MAKPVYYFLPLLYFFFFTVSLPTCYPENFQSSQTLSQNQVIEKIKQLLDLDYPTVPSSWNETETGTTSDFCNSNDTTAEPKPSLKNPTLACYCYQNNITQLHIIGNTNTWPPFPMPSSFSSLSIFSTLSSLPNLKVLSLISLGLQGPLPPTIGALSSLEILNLSSNYFSGQIPQELSSLINLQTLILDHNRFEGQVPPWLNLLSGLSFLSLNNNSFKGSLPDSLGSLQNLRVLSLSMNHLSGEVPSNVQNLTNLLVLNLEDNELGPHFPTLWNKSLVTLVLRKNRFNLVGSFFESVFWALYLPSLLSLPSLSYLDISDNKFSGRIFRNTSICNSGNQLEYLNLSTNHLTGELPDCLLKSNGMILGYFGNCLTTNGKEQEQHPYSYCRNEALAVNVNAHENKQQGRNKSLGRALPAAAFVVAGIGVCGLILLVIRRRAFKKPIVTTPQTRVILEKVSTAHAVKLFSNARYMAATIKLGALGLPPYRTFALEEIVEATTNFSTLNLIGEGSLGKVYKGVLADGTRVAIRSLIMRKKHSIQRYTHQIELICKLRHIHLVSALGHCFECHPQPDDSNVSKIYLVFELVPNGTLRSRISEGLAGQKLSWTQRIAAATEVARGIQFLHTGIVPGLFSNNIKITDVLLDHNLRVKISNYNLPLFAECRRSVGAGVGAFPIEPQERTGLIQQDKNDVYDMGVLLLEVIVGRAIMSLSAITVAKDLLQVSLATDDMGRRSIVDPAVHKECSDESVKTLMELCVRCLSSKPRDRPSIEDVIWNLQFGAQVQDLEITQSQGSPAPGDAATSPKEMPTD
ncbi:Non-specific serine/threonine protein kinase [Bertholletia excelsa]